MMNNPMQLLQQLSSNPMQFLMQMKLNVPSNILGDPNAIVNHLLSTGQVSQQQVNRAYQMAQRFK
jgi:hypothetical protein